MAMYLKQLEREGGGGGGGEGGSCPGNTTSRIPEWGASHRS